MATRYFTAVIEGGSEPGFGVFFPDLPGCASAGDTIDEAARNAEEALTLHLHGMAEDGDPIPAATPPDRLRLDPEVKVAAMMLVKADVGGRAIRLNISMEEGLVQAIDEAARARNLTRSRFLAEAARRAIKEDAA